MPVAPPTFAPARPFLKWAGGKRQLLPALRRFVPEEFEGYYEPFIGSGALFFDLYNHGRLAAKRVILADRNADLVGCYGQVRDHVDALVDALRLLAADHARSPRDHYCEVRDRRFNPVRLQALAEGRGLAASYTPALAAMLIYLNRTGFNGLFRLNRRHEFNVPPGRYVKPAICDEPNLRAVSAALSAETVQLVEGSFVDSVGSAREGDLVYFDPPYAPLSRTADFTGYTAAGFGAAHQAELRDLTVSLAERGCWVMLSNSTAPEVSELYQGSAAARAGLRTHTIPARRAINSKPDARGPVLEYLITNVRQSRA